MVDSPRAVIMIGDEQRVHLLEKPEAHRRRELHDAQRFVDGRTPNRRNDAAFYR
jgi:hypothetical protein